jgi:host factor-I protein
MILAYRKRGGYMMKQSINIQDQFLNQLRKDGTFVTVFLLNGFQLKGLVKGFDNFTVLLETEGKQQLIYKHAISTFSPQKNIQLELE